MRPMPLAGAALWLALLMTGCTTSIYGWTVRTNSTAPAESFHPVDLAREPVAIFEGLAMPGIRGNEAGMAHYLAQILGKVAPHIKVISPETTATRINQNGLAQEYALMRMDAENSYILNRDTLRKVAQAVGARYVFQPRLASFMQVMTDRWKVPGLELRVVQTRSSVLRMSLQLWQAETGELLWASVAEAILSNEAVSQDPVFLEEEAKVALGSMLADFLNGKTSSQYTPLNEMLDQLIEQPPQATKPDKETGADGAPESK